MFAPASFVEGWAHYTEQMMVEAGFRRNDHTFKLGQLAEALIRLGRFIVSIRLHVEDWSVEQGVRFFRDECFMEEGGARREAERGTFDPTYLVYSVGQADAAEAAPRLQGAAGREVLAARVPRSAARQRHRDVRRPSSADARRFDAAICWSKTRLSVMPLYEYECDACGHRFEQIQKFSDPPVEVCPNCGERKVQKLLSSPAIQFKGSGWYITDYARKGAAGTDAKTSAASRVVKEIHGVERVRESKESSKESKRVRKSRRSRSESNDVDTVAKQSTSIDRPRRAPPNASAK